MVISAAKRVQTSVTQLLRTWIQAHLLKGGNPLSNCTYILVRSSCVTLVCTRLAALMSQSNFIQTSTTWGKGGGPPFRTGSFSLEAETETSSAEGGREVRFQFETRQCHPLAATGRPASRPPARSCRTSGGRPLASGANQPRPAGRMAAAGRAAETETSAAEGAGAPPSARMRKFE